MRPLFSLPTPYVVSAVIFPVGPARPHNNVSRNGVGSGAEIIVGDLVVIARIKKELVRVSPGIMQFACISVLFQIDELNELRVVCLGVVLADGRSGGGGNSQKKGGRIIFCL